MSQQDRSPRGEEERGFDREGLTWQERKMDSGLGRNVENDPMSGSEPNQYGDRNNESDHTLGNDLNLEGRNFERDRSPGGERNQQGMGRSVETDRDDSGGGGRGRQQGSNRDLDREGTGGRRDFGARNRDNDVETDRGISTPPAEAGRTNLRDGNESGLGSSELDRAGANRGTGTTRGEEIRTAGAWGETERGYASFEEGGRNPAQNEEQLGQSRSQQELTDAHGARETTQDEST
jgi:hypothetical protein